MLGKGDSLVPIQIAANYSPQLIELLEEGKLEFLEYVKVPLTSPPQSQIRDARRFRRGLLHCWGQESIWLGAAAVADAIQPKLVDEMIHLTDTPYVSTHLEQRFSDFAAIGGFACEDAYELVFRHLIRNTEQVKASIDRELVLENLDFTHGRPTSPICANPYFISEFLQEIDCGFLLDIGHARVSAWHLGFSFDRYLRTLPLERVKELHVHAPECVTGSGLLDQHLPLREGDYRLVEWLVDHTPVQVISLEYGGAKEGVDDPRRNDKYALLDQLTELRRLVERAGS